MNVFERLSFIKSIAMALTFLCIVMVLMYVFTTKSYCIDGKMYYQYADENFKRATKVECKE
jgi:hypothetical protein